MTRSVLNAGFLTQTVTGVEVVIEGVVDQPLPLVQSAGRCCLFLHRRRRPDDCPQLGCMAFRAFMKPAKLAVEAVMRAKDALGQSGEQVAADYLEDRGIRVIDSNWRCSSGEIDIVALDGQELVIVEVKTRRSRRYGDPLEAITRAKLLRLRTLAVLWAREHNRVIGSLRIDAVGIIMDRAHEPSIDHVKGVA